jgi:DNA-binding MarR family transcriptional regulator
MAARRKKVSDADYQTLASLRHALRRFLRFSQEAARGAGIPPQQHQALLAIKGFPGGQGASIVDLADYLHVKHHSAVGLIDRLVRRGLVQRKPSAADRRRVEVHLTRRGEALIERLSAAHLDELGRIRPELRRILQLLEAR